MLLRDRGHVPGKIRSCFILIGNFGRLLFIGRCIGAGWLFRNVAVGVQQQGYYSVGTPSQFSGYVKDINKISTGRVPRVARSIYLDVNSTFN